MSHFNMPKVISSSALASVSTQAGSRFAGIVPVTMVDDRGGMISMPHDSIGFSKFLRLDGLASGNNKMSMPFNPVASLASPREFWLAPLANEVYYLNQLDMTLLDTSISLGVFGGMASGLANGCLLDIRDNLNNVLFDFLDNDPIKVNAHFSQHGASFFSNQIGTGADLISSSVNLLSLNGKSIILDGSMNMRIQFTIRDNISSVFGFTMKVSGYIARSIDISAP